MNNLLIFYNPYYQSDVIKQHLSILKEKSQVAFGKVKSKLNDQKKQDSLEKFTKLQVKRIFCNFFKRLC